MYSIFFATEGGTDCRLSFFDVPSIDSLVGFSRCSMVMGVWYGHRCVNTRFWTVGNASGMGVSIGA